jgi:4-carboxymuconolactone decarboxylase
MARIPPVKREDLNPRQQELYDGLLRTRPRSHLTGPFSVWIHTPNIAEHADRLVSAFRVAPKLDRRLIELIILMMCRAATVQYAWSVHEPLALKEGLTQDAIDAIRARREPDFKRDDERLVYDFVSELIAAKTVSADLYERAVNMFGLEAVIELVTCAGFYGMIGYVLNTFEVPPQPGHPLE